MRKVKSFSKLLLYTVEKCIENPTRHPYIDRVRLEHPHKNFK